MDFESVIERALQSIGDQGDFNAEEGERLAVDLKEYYYQVIQVTQKRYDEVKVILETYFR